MGIVGAGTIGPDIAYYLKSALPQLDVVLVDVRQEALDAALKRFGDYASKAVARGRMTQAQADAVRSGLAGTTDYALLAPCDWVIEAATENEDLKRRIFAQVEAVVRDDVLITSNTSSLPAAKIFRDLRHPERTAGTHFFAPAWRNPIVEVIGWQASSAANLEYLRWLLCLTGKVPLSARDVPCFMLDRIFDNWCNEAALCLDRATAAQIDAVAREFAQAGPFFVLNLANGNPIIVETNTVQADAEGEHYRPAPVFRSVERWNVGDPRRPPAVPEEVAAHVRDRLLGILISQSCDIVDREIGSPNELDLGCRLALGFRKGPLSLMREMDGAEVRAVVRRFAQARPGMPIPQRRIDDYVEFRRHVLVDTLDGVKVITLFRPEALNALHDEMTDEILSVIREFEDDAATAGFVLVGYGPRAFCAGADIGRFPALLGDPAASAGYARDCSRLLRHLDGARKPVVAALNGMALGGGLELAMRCHALVATREAWMQFPEIALGVLPGIGGLVVPFRRWPAACGKFAGMVRRGERLSAEEALALGVVDALADEPVSLVRRAVARVHEMRGLERRIPEGAVPMAALEPVEPLGPAGQRLSAEVIAIIEDAVMRAAQAGSLDEALEIGYLAFGRTACTAAAREGIGAFLERRAPDFVATG